MSTEATQQGATLDSAASAIENLLDADNAVPSNDDRKKQPSDTEKKPVTPEQSESDAQEIDGSDTDAQTSDDEAIDENQNDVETDAEISIPQSLEQLAETYGVDVNTLLSSMKARTKIDGQDGEVALSDLIKSYQLEGHLNKKSMALSEQRKVFEEEVMRQRDTLNQHLQSAQSVLNYMASELYQDYNAVNWNELKEIDPGQWAAKRQEFQEREQKIVNYKHNLDAQMNNVMHQQRAKQEAELVQYYSHEKQALTAKLPEWSNPEKAKAEKVQIRDYLTNQGFNESELSNVLDHRQVILARKAMLYDKLQQSKPAINNKVAVLPKVIKPGTAKTRADIAAENRKVQLSKLKKTGSVHDAARMLEGLL